MNRPKIDWKAPLPIAASMDALFEELERECHLQFPHCYLMIDSSGIDEFVVRSFVARHLATNNVCTMRCEISTREDNVTDTVVLVEVKFAEGRLFGLRWDWEEEGTPPEPVLQAALDEASRAFHYLCGRLGVPISTEDLRRWNDLQPYEKIEILA